LGNESPSVLVPHSGNIHDLLLVLELLGCSNLLLGQEGEVLGCSVAATGVLPIGCSSGTAAVAEGTSYGTAIDVDVDADAGAGVLEGDST
jgi:hypothetical protein